MSERITVTTGDLGEAIAAFTEGEDIVFPGTDDVRIETIVQDDPSNLIVALENGQRFRVSIVAID